MTLICGPRIWSLLFSISTLISLPTWAVELNYVSPETRESLSNEFAAAKSNLSAVLGSRWNCEIFGVRTNLQHEKNIELYKLSFAKDGRLKNLGLSPSKSFTLNSKQNELTGDSDRVEELVRLSDSKRLISKWVHKSSKTTLAFARCEESVGHLTAATQ